MSKYTKEEIDDVILHINNLNDEQNMLRMQLRAYYGLDVHTKTTNPMFYQSGKREGWPILNRKTWNKPRRCIIDVWSNPKQIWYPELHLVVDLEG